MKVLIFVDLRFSLHLIVGYSDYLDSVDGCAFLFEKLNWL